MNKKKWISAFVCLSMMASMYPTVGAVDTTSTPDSAQVAAQADEGQSEGTTTTPSSENEEHTITLADPTGVDENDKDTAKKSITVNVADKTSDPESVSVQEGEVKGKKGQVVSVSSTSETYSISAVKYSYTAPATEDNEETQKTEGNATEDSSNKGTFTFDMPDADVEITVTFEKKTPSSDGYTVTWTLGENAGGSIAVTSGDNGDTVTSGSTKVKQNTTVTIKATPGENKKLSAVTVTKGESETVTTTKGSDDNTYTFTMPEANVNIAVTFVDDEKEDEGKLTVADGEAITVTGLDQSASKPSVTVDKKEKLKENDTVTITVPAVDNYTVQSVTYTYTESEETKTGNATKSDSDATKYTFSMPASNVTGITVTYAKTETPTPATTYAITTATTGLPEGTTATITLKDADGNALADNKAAKDTTVTVEVGAVSSYHVTGITTNDENTTVKENEGKYTFTMPEKDIQLTVAFEADTTTDPTQGVYDITFNLNYEGAENAPDAQQTANGKLASLPEDPTREGYEFLGWFDAATGGNKVTIETEFSAAATVYAQWEEKEAISYTLPSEVDVGDMNLGEGQQVTVTVNGETATTAKAGDIVTITVPAVKGYKIVGVVYVTGEGEDADYEPAEEGENGTYTFTMPAANVTSIVVNYVQTVEVDAGATVDGEDTSKVTAKVDADKVTVSEDAKDTEVTINAVATGSTDNVKTAAIELPKVVLETLSDSTKVETIKVETNVGTVSVNPEVLKAVADQAGSAESVTLNVGKEDAPEEGDFISNEIYDINFGDDIDVTDTAGDKGYWIDLELDFTTTKNLTNDRYSIAWTHGDDTDYVNDVEWMQGRDNIWTAKFSMNHLSSGGIVKTPLNDVTINTPDDETNGTVSVTYFEAGKDDEKDWTAGTQLAAGDIVWIATNAAGGYKAKVVANDEELEEVSEEQPGVFAYIMTNDAATINVTFEQTGSEDPGKDEEQAALNALAAKIGTTQTVASSDANAEDTVQEKVIAQAKTAIENAEGVEVTAELKGAFTAAVDGNKDNTAGTNGSATYTVTLTKNGKMATAEVAVTITAKAFDGGNENPDPTPDPDKQEFKLTIGAEKTPDGVGASREILCEGTLEDGVHYEVIQTTVGTGDNAKVQIVVVKAAKTTPVSYNEAGAEVHAWLVADENGNGMPNFMGEELGVSVKAQATSKN